MVLAEGNVAVAFGLTIAAGSASMIGAAVVFFPSIVKLISRRVLAASLGLSAGVMLYFALVDIFYKSVSAWRNSGVVEEKAYTFASLCVFSGTIAMKVSWKHHRFCQSER
jgi:ZIP family zinc transporter